MKKNALRGLELRLTDSQLQSNDSEWCRSSSTSESCIMTDICPDCGPGWILRQNFCPENWSGRFKNFLDFVWICAWPFSNFLKNPSRLASGLTYHYLGSLGVSDKYNSKMWLLACILVRGHHSSVWQQYHCGTAHDDSDIIIGYDANYNVITMP